MNVGEEKEYLLFTHHRFTREDHSQLIYPKLYVTQGPSEMKTQTQGKLFLWLSLRKERTVRQT